MTTAEIRALMTANNQPCGSEFDFFLRVVTICARPKGHAGPHHPTAMPGDHVAEEAL